MVKSESKSESLECPLCGLVGNKKNANSLYGHLVCNNCSGRLSIRRQFAFLLDVIIFGGIWLLVNVATGNFTNEGMSSGASAILIFFY